MLVSSLRDIDIGMYVWVSLYDYLFQYYFYTSLFLVFFNNNRYMHKKSFINIPSIKKYHKSDELADPHRQLDLSRTAIDF